MKLIDYGLKFLNKEVINNFMSPELYKNKLLKKEK